MKKNIFSFLKEENFTKKIKEIFKSFGLSEKIIFLSFLVVFVFSAIGFLIHLNQSLLISIPERGGVLKEGLIGTPRFINPLIAVSNVDLDMTNLIYSGLVKKTASGEIVPNIADKYEISEDGLIYTFYLKQNAKFHDNESVLADDVQFTIIKAADPVLRSPQRLNWDGVTIEKINDYEIKFILKEANPRFLENATIGILPKHLWENISSDEFSLSKFNIEPIGSGPYKLKGIKKDEIDIPVSYNLITFNNYVLEKPFIKNILFKFAKNQEDLISMYENGEIDSINSIDPQKISELKRDPEKTIQIPLPRIFAIFFNQNENPVFINKEVRQALEKSIPRNKIINEVLFGFASPSFSPITDNLNQYEKLDSPKIESEGPNQILEAQKILENAGWRKNDSGIYAKESDDSKELLSFSISTSNVPELISISEKIVETWKEVGANVELQIFDTADLNQNVIRPRNFESLLFGMVITNYSDLYSFWHSSQRNDPGLNITNYANIETDKILEKLITNNDLETEKELIKKFQNEIRNDVPAIFLYSPQFIYIVPEEIQGLNIQNVITASDRFINIEEWFMETDKVWKIFKN